MRNLETNSKLSGSSSFTVKPLFSCAYGLKGKDLLKTAIATSLAFSLLLSGTAIAAETIKNKPLTIDDLGFSGAMDQDVFTSRVEVSRETELKTSALSAYKAGVQLKTLMDLQSESDVASSGLGFDDGDFDSNEGFRIRRFSTSVKSSSGTLTVGNDWSDFQDFLGTPSSVLKPSETVALGAVTANQLKWAGANGLGVALEQDFASADGTQFEGDQSSPRLVLSWQGVSDSGQGQYRMSALGHEVDAREDVSAPKNDIGWGLNLAGGWRFGDLFAKLSLTLGNSIDSFILSRFSDRSETAASSYRLNEAFNISPSLDYQLTDKGNLHFSVNRFQSSEELAANGVDTLDTVHLGYSWTPWPSTRFGIEYVGKDVQGNAELSDSNEVNFAASKEF